MNANMVTAFAGVTQIASGPLSEVAMAVRGAGEEETILVLDDESGRVIDLDLRGSDADITERYAAPSPEPAPRGQVRGRGRPKLGVVAKEVTLLPRHWEWLAAQKGGASVTLRKLIDEARKRDAGSTEKRQAQDRAYRAMSALAGDLPGFEEASRALFAGNREVLIGCTADWPADIRTYILRLYGEE